jgi:hypothetical protein
MTDQRCLYPGDRNEALLSYLYGEGTLAERADFETHVSTCERCRSEVVDLRGVRSSLAEWVPPEPVRVFSFDGPSRPGAGRRVLTTLSAVPIWAQVAAAVLVMGVAAGVANLDVRYDANGLRIRTGWRTVPPPPVASQPSSDAPWRSELTALEDRLRSDLRPQAPAPVTVASTSSASGSPNVSAAANGDLLRRVRALVEESERREQRELALRLAEAMRELNAQRQADLTKIDRSIGAMQNNTGLEILRTRETINNINNYLVRTSSQQRPQ